MLNLALGIFAYTYYILQQKAGQFRRISAGKVQRGNEEFVKN
jgi:hypothetical protein